MYAGNALATVQFLDLIKVITIRPTALSAVSKTPSAEAPVPKLFHAVELKLSHFVERKERISKSQELTAARVMRVGGRGLQKGVNY